MEELNVRLNGLLFFSIGSWEPLKIFEEGKNLIKVLFMNINLAGELGDRRH